MYDLAELKNDGYSVIRWKRSYGIKHCGEANVDVLLYIEKCDKF